MDEIFSSWYGLGGDWINIGLPQYVHKYHKTYNAYTCCVRNMVMMKLRLLNVKNADDSDATSNANVPDESANHRTNLLK